MRLERAAELYWFPRYPMIIAALPSNSSDASEIYDEGLNGHARERYEIEYCDKADFGSSTGSRMSPLLETKKKIGFKTSSRS